MRPEVVHIIDPDAFVSSGKEWPWCGHCHYATASRRQMAEIAASVVIDYFGLYS